MPARTAQYDPEVVVQADFVMERGDIVELLGERRRGLGYAGFEPAPDLARQPGLALRAAADHDRVGAGFFERGDRDVEGGDVTIDDQRNSDRIPNRAHGAPIRFALVELTARAAVHRE